MTHSEAQAYCTAVTKHSGSNFYYSFLFLPRERRDAMYAVYTFCREVDNVVDEHTPQVEPREQLAQWRAEVEAAYEGTPTHPVTICLAHHARALGIPRTYFTELMAGVEMDLSIRRYKTFEDLYPYCYRVASVVGLICLKIFGVHDPRAHEYATHLGIAFQLTNILRDIPLDAERGRIYLPLEDLIRFNYSEDALLQHAYSSEFIALMRFQCQRAQSFYARADEAAAQLTQEDRRALVVAEIMRAIYRRILTHIERNRYHVFGSRLTVSPGARIALAIGVWVRSRLLGFPRSR